MTNDDQRAAFEAWARTELKGVGLTTHRGDDDEYHYDYAHADTAWQAWQAAIEYAKTG
jgi:hypothetical protein